MKHERQLEITARLEIGHKSNRLNNYSVATDELAQGLQNAAAVLKTQGNDLYKSVALLTAGNAITQDMSKVSAGTRTIALRLAGTEEAKDELIQMGEDVDDMIVGTHAKMQQLIKDYTAVASNAYEGIDILDANGNLRETYDILLDIAKVYKEIQEEDKKAGTNRAQALVEAIAGKNRSNIAASILLNPEMLESVYETAKNSAGSAQDELDKYLDSLEGHLKEFENATQELFYTLIDSGLLGDLIDFGTSLVKILTEIVDKLGTIPSLGLGVAIRQLMLNLDKLPEVPGKIDDIAKAFASLTKAEPIEEILFKDASNSTKAVLQNIGKLEGAFGEVAETAGEAAEATAEIGEAAATTGVGGATKLATAFKSLVPILTNPITILAALAAATYALYKYIDGANDRQREKIKDLEDEYKSVKSELESTNKELDNVNSRIDELTNKGPLSLVEQEELEKLRTQAELLRLAADEQERLLKAKGQQLVSENNKLFNQVYAGTENTNASYTSFRANENAFLNANPLSYYGAQLQGSLEGASKGDYNDTPSQLIQIYHTVSEAQKEAIDLIGKAREEYGSYEKAIASLEEKEKSATGTELQAIQQQISDLETANAVIEDSSQYIDGIAAQVDVVKQSLMQMRSDAQLAGKDSLTGDWVNQADIDAYDKVLKKIYEITDATRSWNAMEISRLFDNSELEITRQELEALAKAGELDDATINKYPKLKKEIEKLDLILEPGKTAVETFKNELAATAEVAEETGDKISEAAEQMNTWASERDAALSKLGLASQERDGSLSYDESWTQYLETIKALNPELAKNQEELEKCALANIQFDTAVKDLSSNFDSYKEALKDANSLTPEFSEAINALTDDLTYLTGVNFSLEDTADFLSDAKNLNLLEEALKGSDKALQELQANAAKIIKIEIDKESVEDLRRTTSTILDQIREELDRISNKEGSGVNLNLRPTIDTALLRDAGWVEEVAGEYATVFTNTFSNAAEDVAINFTPIMVDPNTGQFLGVMERNEFEQYCQDVVDGVRDDDLNLQIGAKFVGQDAIAEAEAEAEKIHYLHEMLITLGLDTEQFDAQFTEFVTWLETAELGTLEAQTYLNEDPFIQGLVHLASQSEEMAAMIKKIFQELGWDIDWDYAQMKVPKASSTGSHYTSTYAKDANGNPIKVGGQTTAGVTRWDWDYLDVPTNIHFERLGGATNGKPKSGRTSTSGYTPTSTSPSQKSTGSSGGSGGSGGSGKDTSKEAEDTYEETIDFFERLIKVLDQKVDLLQAHLEDVVGSFAKNTLIDAQEDLIKQKMAGYSSAIDMYASKASEALSRVPSELQDAVQNGAVAVQDFVGEANEDVVDAINDYQGWADKVAECKQQVVELREELRKLEIQKFDNIVQDFEEINKVRQDSIDLIDKEIALFEESRDKVVGRGFYDVKIEQTQKQLNSLYEERTQLIDQANEALANGINITVPCHSNVA